MGISLELVEKMHSLGLFGRRKAAVLDIGSSNLYSASRAGVLRFLSQYGLPEDDETRAFADRLEKGSAYDPVSGGLNGAFVGELFEKAGLTYAAIDIADGYRTTIVDLNHAAAPAAFRGAFDLVLNFGTTEHLLNQYNAFKVIHDSTRVGGYIVHSLPAIGYTNHGYLTYTPRCFFDIAGYNEYEVTTFSFEGPASLNDLYAPVRDYQTYFPSLANTLVERDSTESGRSIAALQIPDVSIFIVYRKVKDQPFMGALEQSTSVGAVPSTVTGQYREGATVNEAAGAAPVAIAPSLSSRLRGQLRRGLNGLARRI